MRQFSKYPLWFFFFSLPMRLSAQIIPDSAAATPEIVYASPSVNGMGKSKGIIINYEWQPDFGITSTSKQPIADNRKAEVRRNNKLDIKAYVPFVNQPRFKLVGGFNYFFEEFNFEEPGKDTDYPFYANLEDRNLKTISGQLVMLRSLNEKKFYVFRIKGELNGDYSSKEVAVPDYLKTTMEFLYGWRKSMNLTYGVGAQLGYALGRQRIYPAFLYNQTFNKKWGIEALLPANADLRYNASERSLWFGGFSVDGASYNINVKGIGNPAFETLELRRSEIRGRIRWEREIYDFLWLGAEAGYRRNLTFNAYEKDADDGFFFAKNEDPVIENKLKGAAIFSLEIFLVPPRRFLKNK
jgi:hypothetical protein